MVISAMSIDTLAAAAKYYQSWSNMIFEALRASHKSQPGMILKWRIQ